MAQRSAAAQNILVDFMSFSFSLFFLSSFHNSAFPGEAGGDGGERGGRRESCEEDAGYFMFCRFHFVVSF